MPNFQLYFPIVQNLSTVELRPLACYKLGFFFLFTLTAYSLLCKVYKTTLLTPWSKVLLEKLTGFQIVKKFPAFNGNRRFITAFTSVHHLSLSWASSNLSIPPHHTSWRSILILSPIYAWVSQVVSFPQVSPPKPCIRLFPIRATWPAHHILDYIKLTTELFHTTCLTNKATASTDLLRLSSKILYSQKKV